MLHLIILVNYKAIQAGSVYNFRIITVLQTVMSSNTDENFVPDLVVFHSTLSPMLEPPIKYNPNSRPPSPDGLASREGGSDKVTGSRPLEINPRT